MAKPKKIPRRVGHDEDEEENASDPLQTSEVTSSVVKRPLSTKERKAQKTSALRASFDPSAGLDSEEDAAVITPRKPVLGRQVLERNAELLSSRGHDDSDRPSYSADYLAELKSSTPTLPRSVDASDAEQMELDVAAEPEPLVSEDAVSAPTHIPAQAEIREKKERRRRLAAETAAEDYIALDDDAGWAGEQESLSDVEDPRQRALIRQANEISLRESKHGAKEGRLVREDEDIAEGFEAFVDDPGSVTLGKKGQREQEKRRKEDVARQIREAQTGYGFAGDGLSDEDEGEDLARQDAYDAAQVKAGTYEITTSHRKKEKDREQRLRRRLESIPKTRPIPDLKTALGKFVDALRAKELELEVSKKRLESVKRERAEIEKEEERIKGLVEEAETKFEELQSKADKENSEKDPQQDGASGGRAGPGTQQEWGLESIGGVAFSDTRGQTPQEREFEGMGRIPDELT